MCIVAQQLFDLSGDVSAFGHPDDQLSVRLATIDASIDIFDFYDVIGSPAPFSQASSGSFRET